MRGAHREASVRPGWCGLCCSLPHAGFSPLREEHYSSAVEDPFTPLTDSIEPYRPQLLFHKTWGAGIQLVFKTVAAAGRPALAMEESVNRDVPSLASSQI
jgi:hypothetical protein